jgi:uncharacterized protein DUF2380
LTVNRILAMALALATMPVAALAAPKAVVFPFDLIDESQLQYEIGVMPKGISDEEKRRLALITQELTKLLKDGGRYDVVDSAPIAKDIDDKSPMYKCNGCEDDLAKKVGAEVAFIGTVRKASDVLFTVSVYVRDVGKEEVTRQASGEIYGNTDAMWLRAVHYVVQKRLFPEGASQ